MGQKTDNNEADFFQDHSNHYLEMALRADNHEIIENADGYGKKTRGCGDTVEFFLIVRDNRIQSVSFGIQGCIHTNACANTVVFLAEGKSIHQGWGITPQKVVDYLETLPAEEKHCADLAVDAFRLALANFNEIKQEPWRKLYR